MSASFYRQPQSPWPLLTPHRVDPGEDGLRTALSDAEDRIDAVSRLINARVDQGQPAADLGILDEMRRIAGDLMAAADEYQGRPE